MSEADDTVIRNRDQEVRALQAQIEGMRKQFDNTRHRVLASMGEVDMGKSWSWIESCLSHDRQLRTQPGTVTPQSTIAEALARLIEADPHQWSARPCQTCRAASALLDRPFGCSARAK